MKNKKRLVWSLDWRGSLLLCAIYLLPFYVVLCLSLKSQNDNSSRLALPKVLYLDNYINALKIGAILNAIKNNAMIVILTVLLVVVFGAMAAYPLARRKSLLNTLISKFFMGIMMITPLTILVGLYSILSKIKAINTYWGIILILATFSLSMSIYLYSNFISAIPIELEEAACIDGATRLQTFFRIILPQLGPVTTTVVIMQGVAIWNNYLFTHYVMQKKELFTVTQVIQSFFSTTSSDYNGAAAVAVLGMLPVVLIYLFLQRFFIRSAIDSAIK